MPERAPRKPKTTSAPQPASLQPEQRAAPHPLAHLGNQALGTLAGAQGGASAVLAAQAGAGNQAVQRVLSIGTPALEQKAVPAGITAKYGPKVTAELQKYIDDAPYDDYEWATWDEAASAVQKMIGLETEGDTTLEAEDDVAQAGHADMAAARQFLDQQGFPAATIHDPALTDQNCHSYAIGIDDDLQAVTPVSLAKHIISKVTGKTILLCLEDGVVGHTAVQVGADVFRQTLPGGPIFDTTRDELNQKYQCYLLPADLGKLEADAEKGGW